MGIKIPQSLPVLDPGTYYFVGFDFDRVECSDQMGVGFAVATGAEINAYYAAGGDCVQTRGPTGSGTSGYYRIVAIEE